MELRDVGDVVDRYTGLSRAVLEYSLRMKRIVDNAKQPGFSESSWAPLSELVAVDRFERVGNFKDVMDWKGYVAFLTKWATTSEWECSFKRVTELGSLVLLELEERTRMGDVTSAVNSASVYELDADGKLTHLDIYLQMALPEGFLPEAYEGVRIAD